MGNDIGIRGNEDVFGTEHAYGLADDGKSFYIDYPGNQFINVKHIRNLIINMEILYTDLINDEPKRVNFNTSLKYFGVNNIVHLFAKFIDKALTVYDIFSI